MSKISEILRASNAAPTDLMLVTGNVSSTPTSYSVEWKNCNDYYQQSVSVAKDGGQYSTIQSAIDSITDASTSKRYVIEIYPGDYTENVVLTKNISLKGMGGNRGVVGIINSSGTILTLPTDGSCGVTNLRIQASGTASAIAVGAGSTSFYRFDSVGILYIQASGYTNLIHLESGNTQFNNCRIEYISTGATSGTNYHRVLYINGTSSYNVTNCNVSATIDDPDDTLDLIEESSVGGSAVILGSRLEASGTADIRGMDIESAGAERDVQNNYIFLQGNTAGIGTAFKMDDVDSEITSMGNRIEVIDFTNSYYADIGVGATFVSTLDNIIAEDGLASAGGDVELASSLFAGHISMTNVAIQVYDMTGGTNTNAAAPGTAIPFNAETFKDDIFTHSTSVNPSRISVAYDGVYEIAYHIGFIGGGNNVSTQSRIMKNGSVTLYPSQAYGFANSSGVGAENVGVLLVELEANDYIEVYCQNDSGSTSASNTQANESWITIKLIRSIDKHALESSSSSSSVDSSSSSSSSSSE